MLRAAGVGGPCSRVAAGGVVVSDFFLLYIFLFFDAVGGGYGCTGRLRWHRRSNEIHGRGSVLGLCSFAFQVGSLQLLSCGLVA